MGEPVRIQRRRVLGWRKPDGAVYVGRGSLWGNPFAVGTKQGLARVPAVDGSPWEYENRISADGARHDYHHLDGRVTRHDVRFMTQAECVEVYQRALLAPTASLRMPRPWWDEHVTVDLIRERLAGRTLMCWCAEGEPCHGDVLLKVANSTGPLFP